MTHAIAPQPALVLFDLDDTLCDYAAARDLRLRTAFSRGAAVTGYTIPPADLAAMVAASIATHPHGADHFADIFAAAGFDPAGGAIAREWYVANRFHGLALLADAVATIDAVRAALPGRRIGLVTNGPAEVQRPKIDLLDIGRHVDFTLVSGEVGVWKPEPAIFHEALRRGQATAADAVMVGDSAEHDIAGAQASGIRSIWMARSHTTWQGPGPAPDHIARDLATVRRLLGGH